MTISFSDFKKLELKIGTIRAAERVPNSEKLIKLEVDFGFRAQTGADAALTDPEIKEIRQIMAGIGKAHAPESLIDTQCIFITNLEPRILMGLESQGMILAASDGENNPVLLKPEKSVVPGSLIR